MRGGEINMKVNTQPITEKESQKEHILAELQDEELRELHSLPPEGDKCPVCGDDVTFVGHWSGPDDFDIVGARCEKCDYFYDI